jgi:hypothetical protein
MTEELLSRCFPGVVLRFTDAGIPASGGLCHLDRDCQIVMQCTEFRMRDDVHGASHWVSGDRHSGGLALQSARFRRCRYAKETQTDQRRQNIQQGLHLCGNLKILPRDIAVRAPCGTGHPRRSPWFQGYAPPKSHPALSLLKLGRRRAIPDGASQGRSAEAVGEKAEDPPLATSAGSEQQILGVAIPLRDSVSRSATAAIGGETSGGRHTSRIRGFPPIAVNIRESECDTKSYSSSPGADKIAEPPSRSGLL